jgi:hypothetical protein
MWIFTSQAFVSIVEHRDNPDRLIVRGRFRGDASAFLGLPDNLEQETPAADYRFRVIAIRAVVERAILRAAANITYPNFKDSMKVSWRKSIAMRVWSILHGAQHDRVELDRMTTAKPLPRVRKPKAKA